MTALQVSSYTGASIPAFAAGPAKPQKLRDVEANLLKPGVTVEAIKSAYNEWLKRIELSNPVKFRQVVEKVTQMILKDGYIYETATPAWKLLGLLERPTTQFL